MVMLEQAELSLHTGKLDDAICRIYGCSTGCDALTNYKNRFLHILNHFRTQFGGTGRNRAVQRTGQNRTGRQSHRPSARQCARGKRQFGHCRVRRAE